MGLDFYGIEISARIKVPYKKEGRIGGQVGFREYELWVNNSDSYLVPNALKDLSYVQDVTVQIGLGLNSKVSLTLAPPLDEGLELIHSPLVNWASSELKVQIGYSTGDPNQRLSMEFGGLMMKPDVRLGPNVSITLNALGVAYGMNLSSATSERTYPAGSSPWDAVKDTLTKHLNVDIVSDSQVFPDLTADQMNPLSKNAHPFFKPVIGKKAESSTSATTTRTEDEKLPISKGPRNDWWFVRELVARYGLEIVIRDKSVVIRDPQKWKLGKPKYIFVLKGNINTDAETPVYPILDFNSPSAYVWLGEGSGGALISDVSPDKKQEVEKLLTTIKNPARDTGSQKAASRPSTLLTSGNFVAEGIKRLTEAVAISRTGQGAYDSSAGGPDAYQVFPGSPDDHRVDQVIGELRNYNNNRGIQAEVTSIGIPSILPADVVYLDGLAPEQTAHDEKKAWFNGKYGVMMVEHNIGTAGMTTKFKAIKNFFPAGMVASVDQEGDMGGQVNKSSIDDFGENNIGDTIKRIPK